MRTLNEDRDSPSHAVAGLVVNGPNRFYRGEGKGDPVDEVRHEEDPTSVFHMIHK